MLQSVLLWVLHGIVMSIDIGSLNLLLSFVQVKVIMGKGYVEVKRADIDKASTAATSFLFWSCCRRCTLDRTCFVQTCFIAYLFFVA